MFRVIKKPIVFMLIMIMLMASTATSVYAKNDKNSVTPDTIYYNGTIMTMNDDQPIANSLAIKGDKIVAVGDMKDLKKLIGKDTKMYNLDRRTIIPGLQDSHIHWSSLGLQTYYYADFNSANNIAEIQQILKDHIAKLEKDEKINWTYQNGEFGPFVFGSLWNQD